MAVTAALVKELRQMTGAGMMDCKKALTETDGNVEAAVELMRKKGQAKAAKKAGRIAAEGRIVIQSNANLAAVVEFNCETDFVARDESFVAFTDKVTALVVANKITSVETLLQTALEDSTVEETRLVLVNKIGENIQIRRIQLHEQGLFGVYVHSGRIGVVVALDGGNEELAKDLAMHVAASNPQFIQPSDVPAEVLEKEKGIQIQLAINSGKPPEIAEKMVAGRMKKFTHEVSLTGQPFVKDPSIEVSALIKQHSAKVLAFTRFEVGEGIEKKEEDFASEVQKQIAAAKGE